MRRQFWYVFGWIFVRPVRWAFLRMITPYKAVWLPYKEWGQWWAPNIHWWILRGIVLNPLLRVRWDSRWARDTWWRAQVHRFAVFSAGYAQGGGACFHCGAEEGDPGELSTGDGPHFDLQRTWQVPTLDGTDYRFCGITTCPRCGYKEYYEDGSL